MEEIALESFDLHPSLFFFFNFFNCILGFGVHEQNMQDSCIGTHMQCDKKI